MNRAAQAGGAGQRCALNLGGIGADEIERGDWIVASHLHAPTARFDVQLTLSPHAPAALRHWAPVHLHLAASHVMARVALPESVARLAALVQELEHATGEARAACATPTGCATRTCSAAWAMPLDMICGERGSNGREACLVVRPDFKSGWGCQPLPGGFDSLPPPIYVRAVGAPHPALAVGLIALG